MLKIKSKINKIVSNLPVVKTLKSMLFKKIADIVNLKLNTVAGGYDHLVVADILQRLCTLDERLYRNISEVDRDYTQLSDLLHTRHGLLRSTRSLSAEAKFDANMFFQIQEKAKVAMTVCSMYRGGDYFEFGSSDMQTFRNFLSAFDIFNLDSRFPDTQFYAFDIFGKTQRDQEQLNEIIHNVTASIGAKEQYVQYLSDFKKRGDLYQENLTFINEHGLYVDRCHLVQGYFENTLNPSFKSDLKERKREIGFAFLDCNLPIPYKLVFEFIFDLMAPHSYIYLDEYYDSYIVNYFEQFATALKEKRKILTRFVCKAGGFGALFFLCPHVDNLPPLNPSC